MGNIDIDLKQTEYNEKINKLFYEIVSNRPKVDKFQIINIYDPEYNFIDEIRSVNNKKKFLHAPAFDIKQPYKYKKEFHILKIIGYSKYILKFEYTELIEYLYCKIDNIYFNTFITTANKNKKFNKYLKILDYLIKNVEKYKKNHLR